MGIRHTSAISFISPALLEAKNVSRNRKTLPESERCCETPCMHYGWRIMQQSDNTRIYVHTKPCKMGRKNRTVRKANRPKGKRHSHMHWLAVRASPRRGLSSRTRVSERTIRRDVREFGVFGRRWGSNGYPAARCLAVRAVAFRVCQQIRWRARSELLERRLT